MQSNNISKEIQQIQNNIGIIISYFFIKKNHTLVPKIDIDYINNQINNLSEKINKLNLKYSNQISDSSSSFSQKNIEVLNKFISQIHQFNLSETKTSKYIDDKRIKEIETMIQKQKWQIRELGALLLKCVNTPLIQTNSNSQIILENEISKLNAQIRVIDDKINLFKSDINKYINEKRIDVNKSLKLFSGEYNQLLLMINLLNTTLTNKINTVNTALTKTITQKEAALNTRIDKVNTELTKTITQKEAALNTRINTVNTALTKTITQKEAALNTRIDKVNTELTKTITQKEAALNTRINTVNTELTKTITQKEAALNTKIDKVNTELTKTITQKESALNTSIAKVNTALIQKEVALNTEIELLSIHINNNFDVLYEDSNQNSGRTVYFNKIVVENIECNNFTGVSDERLKKNIVDLKNIGRDLHKLRTVGFDWKSNNETDIGFIAQDVEKIFPSLVKTNKDGFKSVKYINFVPILVQGYREQADEIKKLKKILIIGLVVFFFFFMYKCI
jgi:hypothetical protein